MADSTAAKQKQYILNVGSGIWQVPLISACRRLGYRVIAVDIDPSAPGFRLADHVVNLSAHEPEPIYRALVERGVDLGEIEAVITTASRGCITTAATLAGRIGVPGPGIPLEAAEMLVERERFRQFLVAHSFDTPRFSVVSSARAANGLPYPAVVKSNQNTSGSAGITLIKGPGELPAAVERAQQASESVEVIVEEFIEGPDVGVFGLFCDGEPTAEVMVGRSVLEAPHFLPYAYVSPVALSTAEAELVGYTFRRLAECLGVSAGPLYLEVRLSADGKRCYPIEAEPTIPAHIDYLMSETLGADVNELAVRGLLGRLDGMREIRPTRAAGCRFLYAPSSGYVAELRDGLSPEGGKAVVRKANGDYVANSSAADICAVLYASSDSSTDVTARLDEWERSFVISTRATPGGV